MIEAIFLDDRFSFAEDSLVRDKLLGTLLAKREATRQERVPVSFDSLADEERGNRGAGRGDDSYQISQPEADRDRKL